MPPYICIPPVHKQHKESMLCQTKGVSICPHRFRCHHMLGYHLYVGMPPLCLDAAICLDAPPVCLNATLCLNTPICLDTPVCLDVLHMFGFPLCVWMWVSKHMAVSKCIRGIQNKHHKESMLCQTKGLSICPHSFRCHHMLGYHLCVGMPPLCLDAAICLDAPPICLNVTLC